MKCLILVALVALGSAMPQAVFLVPSGSGGSLQQLTAEQLKVFQDTLGPLLASLQEQQTAVAAPAEEAVPVVETAVPAEAAPAPAGEIAVLSAEPVAPVQEAAAPVQEAAAPVVEVMVAAEVDPSVNLVDPKFQSFIFPDDTPEIAAAKRLHFAAVTKALGGKTTPSKAKATTKTASKVEAAEAEAAEAEAAEAEAAEAEAAEAGEAELGAEAEAAEVEAAEAEAAEAEAGAEAEVEAEAENGAP